MTAEKYICEGKELHLGKKLAQGGEGKVFLLDDQPSYALKAYLPAVVGKREAKIRAMVKAGLSGSVSSVAFPEKVVTDAKGNFAGFLMKLVSQHKEIHELQTPGSRQKYFPKADYKFIVRVAVNIARIFANIHAAGCVVGDINQRGILVSPNATVVLIDADSFQFSYGSERFLCDVGVPEYTPPELQGKTLKEIVRTADHDAFGLAVCLFQLLCMDRHPFVGRHKHGKDITTEQAIKDFRFAYSSRDTDMDPPPGTPRLTDFPDSIRKCFEDAFSPQMVGKRPAPRAWITVLEELEKSLRQCSVNSLHHYSRVSSECPWCRMEATYGRPVFVSSDVQSIRIPGGRVDDQTGLVLDLQAFLASIAAANIPDSISINLPTVNPKPAPSNAVKEIERQRRTRPFVQLMGVGIGACSLYALAFPSIPKLFPLIGFGLAAWAIFRQSPGASELKKKYDDLAGQIRKRAEELQTSAPIERAHQLKFDASTYVDQYKRLSASYKNAQADYDAGRRQKQLDDHLNNFFIRNAKIDGINSGNIASLNSYGFFTAYDVKKRDVQTVHGIGPVKKSNIMAWLRRCEAKFVYSPVYTQVDQQNIKAGQAKIIDAQKATEDKLREVVTALQTDAAKYETWKKSTEAQLLPLMREIAQVQVDLEHLGLPVTGIGQIRPYIVPVNTQYRSVGYSSYGASTTTGRVGSASPATPSPTPTCPMCNRLMVKRTARQGRNRGGQFWGCSNFPRCTGTRPI